jgi:hypothetical protein
MCNNAPTERITLHYIDAVRVDRCANHIARQIKMHRCISSCVTFFSFVHEASMLIDLGKTYIAPWFMDISSSRVVTREDSTIEPEETPTFWEVVSHAPGELKNFVVSGAFIGTVASLIKDIAVYTAVSSCTRSIIKRVQHPNTIDWYATKVVKYHEACKTAKRQANECIARQEHKRLPALLVCTGNALMSRALSILGYIKYKETLVLPSHARQLRIIGIMYLQEVQDWKRAVEAALQEHNFTVAVILFEQLEGQLDRAVEACLLHESYLKNNSFFASLI